tara:strand:- start:3088 stop:3861 length:774 start_codon:yes stop_codon:yes gene_type:complete
MTNNNQYKSIFLSDIHLGFNGCQNEKLESFLSSVKCESLYLVGDIIDFWSMADNFYWPEEHQRVLNIFETKHQEGTKVFYISGNHDDPLRDKNLINELKSKDNTHKKIIELLDKFEHKEKHDFLSKKYGKFLILHGDQYDVVTSNAKWLSKFGGLLYDLLIYINRPLSKYLKNLTKKIVSGASGFQKLVKKECEEGDYDGLLCGHNHRPEILKFKTHIYMNTGDWVESCSAIVEEIDGTIKLIKIDDKFGVNTLAKL